MPDIIQKIILQAQNNASKEVKALGNDLSMTTGLAGNILGVAKVAGEMALGLGAAAVNASGSFQTAMLANAAHAGLAKDQIDSVSQSVLTMAPTIGQMPTALAQALYPVLSSFSGISNESAKAQISLTELKDAGESVAGSTTSVTSVTNAASAAFNAYGLATNDTKTNVDRMNTLFDEMNSTVSAGNMQWSNYAGVIGKLSVTSKSAGVSFNEENAALADLTNSGYSAQTASTYLGNTFTQLDLKTDSLAKNAKKLHISFDEAKFKSMSLGDQIRYLNQITDGNSSSILKLLNNNSVAARTVSALSGSIQSYQGNLDSLNHSQGATAKAFETASSGFQFSMQKLQAAGQTLLITIGQQLLPILSQVANQVVPIVTQFADWLVKSGALKNIASTLGGVLHNVVTVLINLATATQHVIVFFQQNHAALVALGSVGIAVAGAIAAVLIVAFYGWAVAAGAAAIATLAATWPILAIGALIALVVAGIILAVQHWGEIMHWLQGIFSAVVSWLSGAWSAFASWFMGAMHALGAFFQAAWNVILNILKIAAIVMLTIMTGGLDIVVFLIVSHWNDIVNFTKSVFNAILSFFVGFWNNLVGGVQEAIHKVVSFFSWLYDHNYYFKALVDFIHNAITNIINFLKNAWQTTVNAIVGTWHFLSTTASTVWNTVVGAIRNATEAVLGWLRDRWNTVLGWLTAAWNAVSGVATTAWNAVTGAISTAFNAAVDKVQEVWSLISGIFSSAWTTYIANPLAAVWTNVSGFFSNAWTNYIAKPIASIGSSINGVFNDMAKTALQWGANVINGIANGIKNALGGIKSAVSSVASTISGWLGFHSPTREGPGQELEEWPKNMMASYSRGLVAAIPQLQSSLQLVMKPVATTLGGGSPIPTSASIPRTSAIGGQVVHNHYYNISTMARSQSEVRRLMDMIATEQAKDFRVQSPGYAAGGVY